MPIDRGILEQQLDTLGGSARWWNERELRDLPSVLLHDETLAALARGKLGRLRFLRRSWLVAVTDRRLLCLRSGRGPGWRQFELGMEQVQRVGLRIGPFRGRVVIHTTAGSWRLLLPRHDAYEVYRALEAAARPALKVGRTTARRVVQRVIDHILAFPAAALEPEAPRRTLPPPVAPPTDEVAERVESLQAETEELRQQVAFLEQLLRERQAARDDEAALLAGRSP
jgi:hypothetical protein